ncbi:MAG: hypothetical protein ACFCUL_12295 [Flavobacteriaceae bacterium]
MIKRAVGIFLLLLFLLTLFFWYRNYSSYQNALPINTSWAIKLQVDGLLKDMALNALGYPSYYLEGSKVSSDNEKDGLKRGFRLPANIFAYGVKGQPNAIFTRLPLADSSHFKAFVSHHLKLTAFTQHQKYTVGHSDNQHIQVLFNHKLAVITYFIKNPDQKLAEQVFFENQFIQKEDTLLARLKSSKNHLTFIQDQKNITFHFGNGEIKMQGNLPIHADWEVQEKVNAPQFDPESALTFYSMGKVKKGANLNTFLPKIKFNLEADSLIRHFKGGIGIQVGKPVVQQDSVITYEYDDDFEKVALPTVQESKVPSVEITIDSDADKLMRYLKGNNALSGTKLNRNLSPYLDLGVFSPSAERLVLSNSTFSNSQIQGTSEYFARLEIDFQKLQHYKISWSPFPLENFEKLDISASKKGEKIEVSGYLGFLNTEINALTQLNAVLGR